MTDYKMTDEKRKKLTELLGECWHEWEWVSGGGLCCKNCAIDLYGDNNLFYNKVMGKPENRTFATITDMLAVFRVFDKGKWDELYWWAVKYFAESKDDIGGGNASYMRWLLDNPERACCLAAMFLEGQG